MAKRLSSILVALVFISVSCFLPVAMAQLDSGEQELWHSFYNQTNGANWRQCSQHYDTPCLCGVQPVTAKKVKCDGGKITEIILPRNDMTGTLPVDALNSMTSLDQVILVGNDDLALPEDSSKPSFCADLSICREHRDRGRSKCRISEAYGTRLTPCSDVAAWTALFIQLGGDSWNRCSEHRLTPCFCGTYPQLDGKRVRCDADFHSILEITLPNNNMEGEIDAELLQYMSSLETLNIDINNKLSVTDCLALPMCLNPDNSPNADKCKLPFGVEPCAADATPPTKTPTVRPTPLPTRLPTASPVVAEPVVWEDLQAWKALFDATGGVAWQHCHNTREAPCACGATSGADNVKVTCEALDPAKPEVKSITGIELVGVGLDGFVPSHDLNRLKSLEVLNLAGNDALFTQEGVQCVVIGRCSQQKAVCGLPETAPLCPGFIDFAQGTFAPTTAEEIDLVDWVAFFDDTKGETWKHCSENRATPCDCQVSNEVKVECDGQQRITKIKLRNNNLVGVLSAEQFATFTEMNRLELRDNPELRMLGNECLRMDECGFAITCNFDENAIRVCEPILTRVESGVAVPFLGYRFGLELFLILGLLLMLLSICLCVFTYRVCGCCCFCFMDEDMDEGGHDARLKDSPEEDEGGGCVVM